MTIEYFPTHVDSNNNVVVYNPLQYPWGLLHNDFPMELVLDNQTWQSVSHYIYTNLPFLTPVQRQQFSNLTNVADIKIHVQQAYTAFLENTQASALSIAYRELLEQNERFASMLSTMHTVEFRDDHPVFGISTNNPNGANLVGRILTTLRNDEFGTPATDNFSISILPNEWAPQNTKVVVDSVSFNTIIDYVYFNYLAIFIGNQRKAYTILNGGEHEVLFNTYQDKYFKRALQESINAALDTKYSKEQFGTVLAHLSSFVISDSSFIGHHVTDISTRVTQNIHATIPKTNLTVLNTAPLLNDPYLYKWIANVRITDIVRILNIVGFDCIQEIQEFLKLFYPSCTTNQNFFVTEYSEQFFNIIKEQHTPFFNQLTYKSMYHLWEYISLLLYLVHQQYEQSGTDYQRIIQDCMQHAGTVQLPFLQIYYSFSRVLYAIQRINILINGKSILNDEQIRQVEQILIIPPPGNKKHVTQNSKIYQMVIQDLLNTYNNTAAKPLANRIFKSLQHIFEHQHTFQPNTKSRLFLYS